MGIALNQLKGLDNPDIVRLQKNVAAALALVPSVPSPNIVLVTSDYTVNGSEDAIHANASAGPVRVTLQAPSASNRPLTVKQVNLKGKVNAVTVVSPNGSKTIAGQSSYALDDSGTGSVSFTSDNQQFWPAGSSGGNPPSPSPGSSLFVVGIPPIIVAPVSGGFVVSYKPGPLPPPVPGQSPWMGVPQFSGTGPFNDSSGVETWKAESPIDFSGAPGSLTAYWAFESQSAGGNATYILRLGGSSYQALDGTVIASFIDPFTALTPHSLAQPFVSPGGLQRVTLSMISAGSGDAAKIGFANLLFR